MKSDAAPAGETVASSAFRWLKGSKKAEQASGSNDDTGLVDDADEASDVDGKHTDDWEEDLELSEPIAEPVSSGPSADDAGDDSRTADDRGGDRKNGSVEATTTAAPENKDRAPPPPSFVLDDDDDPDDFDDLGDLAGVMPPEPVRKTSVLADVDLDDLSPSEDLDDEPAPADDTPTQTASDAPSAEQEALPPESDAKDAESVETEADDTPVAGTSPADTEKTADTETIEPHDADVTPTDEIPSKPASDDTPSSGPSDVPTPSETPPAINVRLAAPSKKVKLEAGKGFVDSKPSNASFGASLALQPIPELQSDGGPPAGKTPSKGAGQISDFAKSQPAGVDGGDRPGDLDGSALGQGPEDALFDEAVMREITKDKINVGDIDDLTIAGLEVDALELDAAADVDDRSGDDWHAHLADVLGVADGLDDDLSVALPVDEPVGETVLETAPDTAIATDTAPKTADADPSAKARDPEASDGPDRNADEATSAGDDDSASVLPLSRTLTQLAMSSGTDSVSSTPERRADTGAERAADKTDEVPMPSIVPAAGPRQKHVESPPPPTLPAETGTLTPEQLSLGIIANLPRLRRFAAVQIGDELVADRLVQSTIETALSAKATLQPSSNLGLALIALSHRLRQDMLASPLAPIYSPEAVRAFEATVCRGLAGADQFEIRQFASAMNMLEEKDREILVMIALENFSYDQIASLLRMPIERLMARVSVARMRLRRALASDESDGAEGNGVDSDTPHPQEIEIHGYLDGELDGRHMADIDALVEYDEDAADRLLHYGIQGDLIRRLYAPLLNRSIPGTMLDAAIAAAKPARRGFRLRPRRTLIAGAIVLAIGAAAASSYVSSAFDTLVSDVPEISLATVDP